MMSVELNMYVIIIFKENINCLGSPSLSPSNLFSSPLVSAYTFRILTGFLLNQCKLMMFSSKTCSSLGSRYATCLYIFFFPSTFFMDRAMSKKKNPHVFLDVSIDGDPVERIVIEVK